MNALYQRALVGCIAIFCSTANAQQTKVDSTYLNSHYTARLDFFRKMPDKKHEIVFLGNSLTEGGKWQELVSKKNVINRGISGDVTYGIWARLDEVLSSRPSKIFLLCGINDMKRGTPNEVILANIAKIATRVKRESPKTRLFIQSLLPVNEAMLPASYNKINNARINELNSSLETLCRQTGATYVDLHPALEDQEGSLRKELSIDGLHLRQASYILWANHLKKLNLLD